MSFDPIRITARQQLAGEKICGASSPPPGVSDKEVRGYRALERSGQFTHVSRDSEHASASLRGRVIAIEEVDRSKTQWHGRLVLELALVDPKTSETLWSEQFEELEPLRTQSPEGLAEALSIAMTRIADRATPAIADHARRRAQLTARTP